jgi:nucleotide-binding universal stress UspA family protein
MLRAYEGPPRVIVGFDGSDDATIALRYGVSEALARNASLVLLNAVDDTVLTSAWGVVFDPEQIRHAATDLLAAGVEEAVAAGMPRERVATSIELGNPAAALAVHSEAASLIVLGRRSVVTGERPFVGSTAVGVAGAAHCPVVVVSSLEPERSARTGVIGVGVNTAAKGAVALEWALQEADRRGGRVVVISVCKAPQGRFFLGGAPSPEQQAEAVEVTRQRITELVAAAAADHPGVEVGIEVYYGSPLDILVSRSADLDLLVVEAQAGFPTYSIGGVTRGLMTHARCPVGTIRSRDSHGS